MGTAAVRIFATFLIAMNNNHRGGQANVCRVVHGTNLTALRGVRACSRTLGFALRGVRTSSCPFAGLLTSPGPSPKDLRPRAQSGEGEGVVVESIIHDAPTYGKAVTSSGG